MASVTVRPGQTLADIAVEHLGSAERMFELAELNGLPLTAPLTAGDQVELPNGTEDERVVNVFERRANKPAANISPLVRQGIAYWAINENFIIQ